MRKQVITAGFVATLASAVPATTWAQGRIPSEPGTPASEQSRVLSSVSFEQRLDTQVPLDTPFRDEHGREVRLGDYFGKRPVILALVYYECPMLCTQVLNGLVSALDVLTFEAGREFDVVAISFDPGEGPGLAAAKKRAYVERYGRPGTEGAFHFLTGTEESIRKVTDAVGFHYVYDESIDQYAHAAGVTVLTPKGRISRYYYGIEYSPRDLRLGLVEAADNRIGNPADQILLYCYHYDPSSGKYGLVVMNVLRAGAVVTMACLLSFWFVMWRRGRGPRARAAEPIPGEAGRLGGS